MTAVLAVTSGLLLTAVRERSRSCRARGGETSRTSLSCDGPRLGAVWADAAGDARLTFEPWAPGIGDVISVTYQPDPRLENENSLRLRGRTIPAGGPFDDRESIHTLTRLDRTGATFRGTFRMPGGALYLQLSVESEDGAIIDSNEGLTWELVVHGPDGAPLHDALVARARANWGVDARRLEETGRLLQTLGPRRPWGSFVRVSAEEMLAGRWGQRVTRGRVAGAYRAMHADLRDRPGLEFQDLIALEEWARNVLAPSRDIWRDRVASEYPMSAAGRRFRDWAAHEATIANTPARLDSLHAIWGDAGAAVIGPRAAAVVRNSPDQLIDIISRYPDIPALYRADAARLTNGMVNPERTAALRKEAALAAFETRITDRPLTTTRKEYEEQQAQATCASATQIARNLFEQGAHADAGRVLQDSRMHVAGDYCESALTVRAALRLLRGDSASAIADWTELAARNPARQPLLRDSVRRASAAFDSVAWEQRVRAREREIWRRTLSESTRRAAADVIVHDATGAAVSLHALRSGAGPMVLMLTTPEQLHTEATQTIEAMAEGVEPLHVQWVLIVRGAAQQSEFPETFPARAFSVYWDPHGEAGRALEQRRLHEFIVIDRQGLVRLQTGNAYIARRRAVMLTVEADLLAPHGTRLQSGTGLMTSANSDNGRKPPPPQNQWRPVR